MQLNFIPTVGLLLAVVLPLPILYLAPIPTWPNRIFVLVASYLVQFLVSNFIEPVSHALLPSKLCWIEIVLHYYYNYYQCHTLTDDEHQYWSVSAALHLSAMHGRCCSYCCADESILIY